MMLAVLNDNDLELSATPVAERNRLVALFDAVPYVNGEQVVSDLEAVVYAEAAEGASAAATKVVTRGIIISAGVGLGTMLLSVLLSRR